MNNNVTIVLTNNNSTYNSSITGYFIHTRANTEIIEIISGGGGGSGGSGGVPEGGSRGGGEEYEELDFDTFLSKNYFTEVITYPTISTPIFFPINSNSLTVNLQVSNSFPNIVFNISLYNDLKFTLFELNVPNNTPVINNTNTEVNGTINTSIQRNFTINFNVGLANIENIVIITPAEILTQTVTKSAFALVESGLTLCQIESIKKSRLNQILKNIQALRNYSRDTGSTTTYNNNGSLNQAGSRYTENFPSAKFANSVGINELLLNKKKYMFSNSLNKNVVSGPIASNTLSGYSNTLPYNAGSSGLTKVQQFANAARGRTLSGGPGRRYGVQFYDGRSLVSIPNIYNQTNQTTQTINICDFT